MVRTKKVDPNWVIKTCPKELKDKMDELLTETQSVRDGLDMLDKAIQEANTIEDFKSIAKRAVGMGNYLRKKLGKLVAIVKNVKSTRYLEIKLDCIRNDLDFVSVVAQEEASAFVGPLRTVRDLLESYVISADNLISICRMHVHDQRQFQATSNVDAELQ